MKRKLLSELTPVRTPRESQKPFVVVGNDNIDAEELMLLYGLVPDECYLGNENDLASYMMTGKTIKLFDRPNKDYKEHLSFLLKKEWDDNDHQVIKKARKKSKFEVKDEWMKKLKRRGKL